MDQDLQDLLALWLGDHDPGEARREALLARLRGDDAFRRAFIEEIRLLGMLRAVQSAHPRWLQLEDEIGWSAREPQDVEALALRVAQEGQPRRGRLRLILALAAVAALVLLAGGLSLLLSPGKPPEPKGPDARAVELATAIKVEDVRWEAASQTPSEGSVVTSGRVRLRSGRLTLAFFSGVALTVEGPADLELVAVNRVFCHQGKLRARVPGGAEGFTVLAAGMEVVDLGTEFAFNLEPGGKSKVMVFEGEAAVSVLAKDGRSVRSALLDRRRQVEVDPDAVRIRDEPLQPEAFISLAEYVPAALELGPAYAAEVLAAKPWGYWRFASLMEGLVPNEVVPDRPGLKPLGGADIERTATGNGWARFRPDAHAQAFLMNGEWAPPRAAGYAIELWVQADVPSASAYSQTALVSLIARKVRPEHHLAYLELTARGRRSPHEPCAVRALDRWPAGAFGANVFSRRTFVPSLWHHVVWQKSGDQLELYVDGEHIGSEPAKLNAKDDDDAGTTSCRLLVGRLKQRSNPPHTNEIRAFEGRLSELAVYDRPLTAEEIQRHARKK
jgi:hypothetical protein